MPRASTPSFVAELPLRVSDADARTPAICFEAARQVYKACASARPCYLPNGCVKAESGNELAPCRAASTNRVSAKPALADSGRPPRPKVLMTAECGVASSAIA